MTADERAKVRDTLRAAVSRALLPGAEPQHPGPIALVHEDPPSHLLERFRAQLTALGGAVHEMETPEAIADFIAGLAVAEAARGDGMRDGAVDVAPTMAPTVVMWHDHQLPVSGLEAALSRRGIRTLTQAAADLSSVERREELAGAVVGVTGVDAALAETGSIVLASGPGRGRLPSLLPPIHVALLGQRLLVDSLADLMTQRPELMTAGANVVCISGPSRTADIEHTLTRGVHGPREVHVILVN